MESNVKRNVSISSVPDNHFSEINSDFDEAPTNGLVPLAVPVKRVFRRALAKMKLREVGIVPTDRAAAILTRTTGRRA